jgi:hypothetical protein
VRNSDRPGRRIRATSARTPELVFAGTRPRGRHADAARSSSQPAIDVRPGTRNQPEQVYHHDIEARCE